MIEHVAALGFVGVDFKWQDVKEKQLTFSITTNYSIDFIMKNNSKNLLHMQEYFIILLNIWYIYIYKYFIYIYRY